MKLRGKILRLLATACGSLAMLHFAPSQVLAQASSDPISACYVPATGNVYRVGAASTPTACRDGHPAFTLGELSLPFTRTLSSDQSLLELFKSGGVGATAVFINQSSGVALHVESQGPQEALWVMGRGLAHAAAFRNEGPGGALFARSENGNAFWAESLGSVDAVGISALGTGRAIAAVSRSPEATAVFNNQSGGLALRTDGPTSINGNLQVSGNQVVQGSKSAVVPTSRGSTLVYAEESSEVWFTDYGFGRLDNGEIWIAIDPLFSETVNLSESYHVFLQAYGPAELFVSERMPLGFRVQLKSGLDNADFSYRLVGKRRGFESRRLDHEPGIDTRVRQKR